MATVDISEKQTAAFHGKIVAPVVTVDVFVRIAGISGALAVALGAYGFHVFQGTATTEQMIAYSIAQVYHLVHTVALLAVSKFARRPMLVGALMTLGMLVFCGSIYITAVFETPWTARITPFGGMFLISSWACAAF